jgi:hypothetical protein
MHKRNPGENDRPEVPDIRGLKSMYKTPKTSAEDIDI